jgi:CelD/BcsL family acetyltransferase involved in cellulose biosynthesis
MPVGNQQIDTPDLIVAAPVVSRVDPLKDPRWDIFVGKHPRGSVFHSSRWLEALARTYRYEPIAYTTSQTGEDLANALLFCRIESWLTGRRLVSLPFSDHCEPLVEKAADREALAAAMYDECREGNWSYVECRPIQAFELNTSLRRTHVNYSFHQLSLEKPINILFSNLHKSSVQRKIRRAEREGLRHVEGQDDTVLNHFYELLTLTRKQHRLPPQPRKWFSNLIECFGNKLRIAVAYKGSQPVSAILTLEHKNTLVYKYGASHPRFKNLGGIHLLLWKAIQEAKSTGLVLVDFGRTDLDQRGLITFKRRWGASESNLTYLRFTAMRAPTHFLDLSIPDWRSRAGRHVAALLPLRLLPFVGGLLYKHAG